MCMIFVPNHTERSRAHIYISATRFEEMLEGLNKTTEVKQKRSDV